MVPPDGAVVSVIGWPLSMVGAEGLLAPATSADLTVTASPGEQRDADADDESVTL